MLCLIHSKQVRRIVFERKRGWGFGFIHNVNLTQNPPQKTIKRRIFASHESNKYKPVEMRGQGFSKTKTFFFQFYFFSFLFNVSEPAKKGKKGIHGNLILKCIFKNKSAARKSKNVRCAPPPPPILLMLCACKILEYDYF